MASTAPSVTDTATTTDHALRAYTDGLLKQLSEYPAKNGNWRDKLHADLSGIYEFNGFPYFPGNPLAMMTIEGYRIVDPCRPNCQEIVLAKLIELSEKYPRWEHGIKSYEIPVIQDAIAKERLEIARQAGEEGLPAPASSQEAATGAGAPSQSFTDHSPPPDALAGVSSQASLREIPSQSSDVAAPTISARDRRHAARTARLASIASSAVSAPVAGAKRKDRATDEESTAARAPAARRARRDDASSAGSSAVKLAPTTLADPRLPFLRAHAAAIPPASAPEATQATEPA